jgi:hypothetical protein
MKARILSNALNTKNGARDYIRLVESNRNASILDQTRAPAAHDALESFRDHYKQPADDPVVPIKVLVKVLTESLQGMPMTSGEDDGEIDGSQLFKGRKVGLRGVPERQFVIRDIFWDLGEIRIEELGTDIEYVLPWNCLILNP